MPPEYTRVCNRASPKCTRIGTQVPPGVGRYQSILGYVPVYPQSIQDPFYDRGSTFPLFCFLKDGFLDPNLDFEKKRSVDLGYGIIRRDAN